MSNNLITRPTRLPDAEQDQSGLGSPVARLRFEAGGCAACTARAVARLKASGMAITGTAAERRK